MMPIRNLTCRALALAGVAGLSLSGSMATAKTPAVGSPITAAEAKQGAEMHPQILQEFGGPMDGVHATYVGNVGKTIALQSGLGAGKDDYKVTLLNSSVNNAFAIPGGYVYVTRQLVALMNSEAELAAVLGHEVGHVSARHSAKRQSTATKNTLLGILGAVVSGFALGNSPIGQTLQKAFLQGSQLLTLKYSRKQEIEADNLGIAYLGKAGYDPRAMSSLLASLAAQNSLDASLQGRNSGIPEWASTHPDPASRVKAALTKAGAGATGTLNRDLFLTNVDNILYGDDPHQGVIEGSQFIHPDLKFTFSAPAGFFMSNGTQAVSINGQSGQAQMSGAPYAGNLDSYIRQVFQKVGGDKQQLAPQTVDATTVNGLKAAVGRARVNTGQSEVDLVVYAYEFSPTQAFHFVTMSPAGGSGVFDPMFKSMRKISTSEAAAVTPRRIDVITVKSGDTVDSLASRMAYSDAKVERFRVLNALSASDVLKAGQKVKIVIKTAK